MQDYSQNPVTGTQSGPVTIPGNLHLQMGKQFKFELEIHQLHGTAYIQCEGRLAGFNADGSWVKIVGYGEVDVTIHGNRRSNELSTDS